MTRAVRFFEAGVAEVDRLAREWFATTAGQMFPGRGRKLGSEEDMKAASEAEDDLIASIERALS